MAHDARISTCHHKAATTVHNHRPGVCHSVIQKKKASDSDDAVAFELFNIHRNGSRVSPGDNIAQFKEHAAQSMAHEARAIKAATTVHKHRHVVWHSV